MFEKSLFGLLVVDNFSLLFEMDFVRFLIFVCVVFLIICGVFEGVELVFGWNWDVFIILVDCKVFEMVLVMVLFSFDGLNCEVVGDGDVDFGFVCCCFVVFVGVDVLEVWCLDICLGGMIM